MRIATLRDLPVWPKDESGDTIQRTYVEELKQAEDNGRAIKRFAYRWRSLWRLSFVTEKLLPTEIALLRGSFDGVQIRDCMRRNRMALCTHARRGRDCVSAHLLLPRPLITVFELARAYRVPTDVVFLQLTGGIHQLWPS